MSEIKLLITIGNSLTSGVGIEDKSLVWPALVGKALDIEVHDISVATKGNRRMIRDAYHKLPMIIGERGLAASEVLVLTMWGSSDFGEYYRGDRWEQLRPWGVRNGQDKRIHAKLFYKMFYHDVGGTINTLVDWVGFEGFLKSQGYHYGFMFGMEASLFPIPDSHRMKDISEVYYALLDQKRLLGNDMDTHTNKSVFTNIGKDFPTDDMDHLIHGQHPLAEGMQFYTENHILPWLEKIL